MTISNSELTREQFVTLRDQFAMAALTGILANKAFSDHLKDNVEQAYALADIALSKRQTTTPSREHA